MTNPNPSKQSNSSENFPGNFLTNQTFSRNVIDLVVKKKTPDEQFYRFLVCDSSRETSS